MTTANAIIRGALGKLGIVAPGEPVKPGDAEDCLAALNTLLDAWRLERLYAYATQTITATVAAQAGQLTIGPSSLVPLVTSDIDVPRRPDRIEAGSYYSSSGVSYPLTPVTEAQFNAITYPSVGGLGAAVFTYTPTLPLGVLRFYPQVIAGATLHLVAQIQIDEFADLATDYALPSGYERALMLTLAQEVGADFEREVPPTVMRNAVNARRLLKRANHSVPQLDVAMGRNFNILAG